MNDKNKDLTLVEQELLDTSGEIAAVREVSMPIAEKMDVLATLADQADKRVAAINKLRLACIRMTNHNDWISQDGKPYMLSSAAEKIGYLMGVSWKIVKQERVQKEDEYIWVFTMRVITPWGREIEVIGTRSSSDPLFAKAHGETIPMHQVDEADVRKSAYTNCVGRGIAIVLGLRNMSWEELKPYGISPESVTKVGRYQGARQSEQTEEQKAGGDEKRNAIRNMLTEMASGDAKKALTELIRVTSFKASDGKDVPGVRSFSYLSGKRLDVTFEKVKAEYSNWKQSLAGTVPDDEGA